MTCVKTVSECKMNKDIMNKLKYVQVSSADMDLSCFPDFFVVGPHRTGTTWLYKNLRRHPQIFMSSPKEIYFFTSIKNSKHPRYVSNKLSWYLKLFSDSPMRFLAKNALSLFNYREYYKPKVRGEASTTYAVMAKDLIEESLILNSDLKAIIMLRNPIDRAWSHAKMELVRDKGRKFEDVPEKEFIDFFQDSYIESCGNYTPIIENWYSILKAENIFTGIFDDISKSPHELLFKIYNFLGVKAESKYMPQLAQKRINETKKTPIPDRYRNLLEDMFKDEVARINTKYSLNWK